MTANNYIIYAQINGHRVGVEISCDTPEQAQDIVKDMFKEIEQKVAKLQVADAGTGYFIRGYS